jgi:hypothetical protein
MDLIETLQHHGEVIVHEGGGNYRIKGHGGLIVKGDMWFQHSTGKGGHGSTLWDMIDPEGRRSYMPSLQFDATKISPLDSKKLLDPTKYVISYLVRERHLPRRLLSYLINEKLLQCDIHNRACFLGYNDSHQLRCVTRRATDPFHRIIKSESPGSDKRYSFSWITKRLQSDLIITESPIDALSVAVMEHHKYRMGYQRTHKIATCGHPKPNLKGRVEKLQPRKVWLYYDNDDAGRAMDLYTKNLLGDQWPCASVPYSYGKDPNDVLKIRMNSIT